MMILNFLRMLSDLTFYASFASLIAWQFGAPSLLPFLLLQSACFGLSAGLRKYKAWRMAVLLPGVMSICLPWLSLSARLTDALTQALPIGAWSVLAVVFAWSAMGLFLLFLFGLHTGTKRWSFYGFLLSLALCALSYGLRRHGENQLHNNPYSIVTVANVTAKSEPSAAGGDVFSIHEGTKVRVMESLNKWDKIRLADGKIGWIPSEAAEKI